MIAIEGSHDWLVFDIAAAVDSSASQLGMDDGDRRCQGLCSSFGLSMLVDVVAGCAGYFRIAG